MIAAMLLMFAQGFGSNAADIRGEWINQRSTAIVRIEDCPSGVCGTVIWSAPTARRDAAGGGIGELNGKLSPAQQTELDHMYKGLERRWQVSRDYLEAQKRKLAPQ